MFVRTTSLGIFFPPVANIREQIFTLENTLAEFFVRPFNLLAVPKEAPPEIPRISATSHHGHTVFNLTMNSANLITTYDNSFNQQWSLCEGYIRDRVFRVYDLIAPIFVNHPFYFGLTTDILFELEGPDSAVEKLKRNLFKLEGVDVYDLLFKLTIIKENTYHINYLIQNQRLLNPVGLGTVPLNLLETSKYLNLNLDINDRYAFNYEPTYVSGAEKLDRILVLTGEAITNKISDIINNGRFDL